ncbi:hypothetical protein FX983_02469 [Pseudomonas frederiksbergensis]|uniref:Uncharacterized protein n=1 Tax=Pseudomonas frederiksbergensis TaxID=104087 RepID=A0A6L5C1K4_9PSED|nr:hypothetical protein FX983_02469 [Pseudomonas frederiksbergensis]
MIGLMNFPALNLTRTTTTASGGSWGGWLR